MGKNRVLKVGVTGHRDLSDFHQSELRTEIFQELKKLKHGHDHYVILDSIAVGADLLCAQIGIELGYELICPLPFAGYRDDFLNEDLKLFDELIKQASRSFVVSDGADKDAAYLTAGEYIAENCDVLIAIWDGQPQQSICGTAAVVDAAKRSHKDIRIISPKTAAR